MVVEQNAHRLKRTWDRLPALPACHELLEGVAWLGTPHASRHSIRFALPACRPWNRLLACRRWNTQRCQAGSLTHLCAGSLARLTIVVWLMLCSALVAGETIVDDQRGFTLTLPDGFVSYPDLLGAKPEIVHCFILGDLNDDEADVVLIIELMGGLIGRERLSQGDLPPGFQGRLFTTRWNAFEVDALEIPEQLGELQLITYNVQIPLKPSAIQVKLMGPADREAELKALLAEVLAGLKGESNWSDPAEPTSGLSSSPNYRFVLLGFAIVFIVGGLVALWVVSRRTPKGTVLVIAVMIYTLSFGFETARIREAILLAGACKMLGVAGGILGVIDLVRKRKPKEEPAPKG